MRDDRARAKAAEVACASSQPSGPPPITSKLEGSAVSSKTVSLVRKPASANPGIEGSTERDPVAIIAFLKRKRIPVDVEDRIPTGEARGAEKRSIPAAARRAAESTRLIRVRMRRTRSIASGKSTWISAGGRAPKLAALRISA